MSAEQAQTQQPQQQQQRSPLESLIESYSRLWGLSREEAEEALVRFFAFRVPTLDNPFPPPIGEISKKVQDINQAVLSTALTQRLLMSPPREVDELRRRLEELERKLAEKLEEVTKRIEESRERKLREELLEEVRKELEALKQAVQQPAQNQRGSAIDELKAMLEESRKLLELLGYRVEPERVTREAIEKMLKEERERALERAPPEELAKRLAQLGYRVERDVLKPEEVKALIEKVREEERKRVAQEMEIEAKRIEAIGGIIRDVIREVVSKFAQAYAEVQREALRQRLAELRRVRAGGGVEGERAEGGGGEQGSA